MASETIDTLIIKIQADMEGLRADLSKTEKELQNFSKSVDKQTSFISGSFKKLGAIAVSYFSIQTVKSIFNTIDSFQKLQTSLISVTGSAEQAATAFNMLQEFAANTPFSIEQVTKTYIRLKAFGIDPTVETLKAFGNIAAATGKDLGQFAEAASKAIVGEMEGLKQFGILAIKEKDKIKLTFQGTTTVISNNADEITKYLQQIGNVKYGDAMALQNETVGGSIDNLIDSVKNLINTLGESGLASAFSAATNAAASFVNEINKGIQRATEGYDAQKELNSAKEQATELENKLNSALKESDGSYSGYIYNLQELLKSKKAEILLLESDVKQQNEGTAARDANKKAIFDQLKEIDKSTIAQKKNLDYLQQEIELYRNLGLSDAALERKELANQLNVLNTEYVKNALSAEQYARASKTLNDRLTELSAPLEFISKTTIPRKRLNTTAIDEAMSAVIPKEKNQLDEFAEAAGSLKDNLISLSMSGIGTLEDSMLSLVNGTKSVKESFRDMTNSIINDIIRMTLRQQISAPIAAALGNIIGSMAGNIVGGGFPAGGSLNESVLQRQTMDFFKSNMTLGRAGGGYVAPNVPYMVGERGAELFVPSAAGKIVNSASMKSMPRQSTIVNQSINISAGVAQTVRAEMYSLLPQIKNETIAAVTNARLRSA